MCLLSVLTGPTSRLAQICEWLGDGDYVVVFDECHKAKNAVTKEKSEWTGLVCVTSSQQAAAAAVGAEDGQQLQRMEWMMWLPEAVWRLLPCQTAAAAADRQTDRQSNTIPQLLCCRCVPCAAA